MRSNKCFREEVLRDEGTATATAKLAGLWSGDAIYLLSFSLSLICISLLLSYFILFYFSLDLFISPNFKIGIASKVRGVMGCINYTKPDVITPSRQYVR